MSAAAAPARRFLLLTWDAALGACVEVVAVLAVAGDTHAAVWLPRVWDRAAGWQRRLDDADVAAELAQWAGEAGGLQVQEIEPGPAGVDVRTAAEYALDELLAVLLPVVDGPV